MYSPKAGKRWAIDEFSAISASNDRFSLSIVYHDLLGCTVADCSSTQTHRSVSARWTRLGWGQPHSASPTRNVVECDSDRAPLLGSPHPYPTICLLWVARSSVGSRVARHLPGHHSSVTAGTLRCGLVFLGGAEAREDRHLGALTVVFCPQTHAGHFGRLVGTATPSRGRRRLGPVRASAHLSRVLVGAGVTPAVRAGSVSASRLGKS